jgi:hypothetical protein
MHVVATAIEQLNNKNMKQIILLCLLMFGSALTIVAKDVPQRIVSRGVVLLATNLDNSTTLMPVATNTAVHWYILAQFTAEPRNSDSPKRVTLSGKVKTRSGFPAEQLPLFFGSDLQPPRLAAITDSSGDFSFNVTLKEDNRGGYLQCSAITNGDIYIGNSNIYLSDSFDSKRELKSGLVRKYKLAVLLSEIQKTNGVVNTIEIH